jgi:hypothetical protein
VSSSPWPATTTVIVAIYSVAAMMFTVYVAARLLPRAAIQLIAAPGYVVEIYRSAFASDGHAALSAAVHLATAVLIAVFAFALIRRAARGIARLLQSRSTVS